MNFPMAPKSVTVNDLERRNGRYFALTTHEAHGLQIWPTYSCDVATG